MKIHQMRFQEFLCGLDGFFFDGSWALGDPDGEVVKLLRIDLDPLLVSVQEYEQRGHCDSFVAVLKGMILD